MKDPAFLFYPNDYIGGTMGMTFEEKGAYIELLMMQFNRGHMTEHMIGQTVGQLWDKLHTKFIKDDKGLWYNERLEIEKEKRQRYTESRRNNKEGINQHTKKGNKKRSLDSSYEQTMTKHMENENNSIDVCSNKSYIYNKFYDEEIDKSNNDINYVQFVKIIFGENNLNIILKNVLSLENQLSYKQFGLVYARKKEYNLSLTSLLEDMENTKGFSKKYTSLQRTMLNWMENRKK